MAADGVSVAEQVDFTWDGSTLREQTTTGTGLPNPVTPTWDHHQNLHPVAQTEHIGAGNATGHACRDEIDARLFAIITDLVGSPTELLDEEGGVARRARSTLWGGTAWAENSTSYTPLRFPGQYHDPRPP
ncbi:hypothetical protein [Streptomyces triticiradicis]|uniref:hypothetical protein n=1 Tax=Streptomyces triticiradicis TaxID=2651189 RepID=UPI001788CB59|nr:hypothetical protein [Streptomyces triticiradicis]